MTPAHDRKATDRYGPDVLSGDWRAPERGRAVETPAVKGDVVEEVTTDFCGEVVQVDRDLHTVTLEDRRRSRRTFPLGPGFLLEGRPVILVAPPRSPVPAQPTRTASGSIAVRGAAARVARQSRIYVEGRHDAELVERVWGDDLRLEGVVVEYLGGVDDLAGRLREFGPGPDVPRGEDWKHGTCERLGWPHRDQAELARAWRHVLGAVRSYADLEPALLGRVEELIDFVTDPEDAERQIAER